MSEPFFTPAMAWIKVLVVTVGSGSSEQGLPNGDLWMLYNNEISCLNAAADKELELSDVVGKSAVGSGLRYDVICKVVKLTEEDR